MGTLRNERRRNQWRLILALCSSADVACWPVGKLATRRLEVGSEELSGPKLLRLSVSHFDPGCVKRTLAEPKHSRAHGKSFRTFSELFVHSSSLRP
jgi:hypothetical protein